MYTTLNPVCTSCQTTIGHIYPIYYRILTKRIKDLMDKKGYSLDEISSITDIGMGDVMDACKDSNSQKLYKIMEKHGYDITPRNITNLYPSGYQVSDKMKRKEKKPKKEKPPKEEKPKKEKKPKEIKDSKEPEVIKEE